MKITPLTIGLHQFNDSGFKKHLKGWRNRVLPLAIYQDEYHYLAKAIEFEDKHFYQVGDITVAATHYEYQKVIANPKLYYFSSALKLHHRVRKAKELGLGRDWPNQVAAPIDIFRVEGV